MELQINTPRLQMMVTNSSADQAGFRYLCVIATEASNLLPLFYRPPPLLYPRFVLPIRGCHHAGIFPAFSYHRLASLNSTVLLCGSG